MYSNNRLELLHAVCLFIFAAHGGCFEVESQEEERNRDVNTRRWRITISIVVTNRKQKNSPAVHHNRILCIPSSVFLVVVHFFKHTQ